jgi:hypothetical protein
MATNPVQIPINGDSSGSITCNSHAAYYQRVTLNFLNTQVVFSGTGEGVPMTTQSGATVYALPPTRQGYSISALFQFSTSGQNGPFQNAVSVQNPIISQEGNTTFISVTSEDSTDNDDNDSYLIIFYQGL